MTTDQHAADALRALVREPIELSEDGVRVVLAAIPDTPQHRSSLPELPWWRTKPGCWIPYIPRSGHISGPRVSELLKPREPM